MGFLFQRGLTEDLHGEEEAGAARHVGDHAAVVSAVLGAHVRHLQVLPPRQPLHAPAQLGGAGAGGGGGAGAGAGAGGGAQTDEILCGGV